MTLNNLGHLHYAENHYPEARQAYEEALAIRRELAQANPAAYQPDLAITLNNLGALHGAENSYPKARQAYERALRIYEELEARIAGQFGADIKRLRDLIGQLPK